MAKRFKAMITNHSRRERVHYHRIPFEPHNVKVLNVSREEGRTLKEFFKQYPYVEITVRPVTGKETEMVDLEVLLEKVKKKETPKKEKTSSKKNKSDKKTDTNKDEAKKEDKKKDKKEDEDKKKDNKE